MNNPEGSNNNNKIVLKEKQTYAHIYIYIEEEAAWATVQVKADDEGVSIDCFTYEGKPIVSTWFTYGEASKNV